MVEGDRRVSKVTCQWRTKCTTTFSPKGEKHRGTDSSREPTSAVSQQMDQDRALNPPRQPLFIFPKCHVALMSQVARMMVAGRQLQVS